MKKHLYNSFFLFFVMSVIISSFLPEVFATSHLPKGLLVAQEYEQQSAKEFLSNVSLLIAFVAGIVTIISPCILPLIPAFFSYAFKEKTQMTIMTLVFFTGFTVMFIAMGITATFLGVTSLTVLQDEYSIAVQSAGVLMILFGVMALAGKGFSGVIVRHKTTHDTTGVFLYGIFFALGWTVCIGPILAGVLSMVALFHNYFNAVLLMFFYSLGMFVPIFLFSYFYDSHHLEKLKWMKGHIFTFSFHGKSHSIHTSNLIAGILFVLIGLFFVISKGTGLISGMYYFGLKDLFYTLQRYLLAGGIVFNIIGAVVLIIVVYIIYKGVKIDMEQVK